MANFRPIVGNMFLFFLIFGMSATVNISNFKSQIRNYRAIGTGLLLQFIILPFLGFAVVKVADFDPVIGITLLIITSSPGGAYSNWFSSIFNADLALSVTMTAISTILSTAMLPLNVLLYSKLTYSSDVLDTLDWRSLGISLMVVVIAITSGIYVSYRFSEGENGKQIQNFANRFGNVAGLGLILFTSLAPEGGAINLAGREPIFYYGTIMPIVLGLIFSVIISTCTGLQKPERVTVSIECVYQNTGIAMTSCLALFKGEEQQRALGVPFWYTGIQTSLVGIYCLVAWKTGWTKAPANENIVKVILQNYQNEEMTSDADENGNGNRKSDLELQEHGNGKVHVQHDEFVENEEMTSDADENGIGNSDLELQEHGNGKVHVQHDEFVENEEMTSDADENGIGKSDLELQENGNGKLVQHDEFAEDEDEGVGFETIELPESKSEESPRIKPFQKVENL